MSAAYRHTQVGHGFLAVTAVVGTVSALAAARSPGSAGPWLGIGIAAACAVLFSSLTVTMDGERLAWRFGAGLIRGAVELRQVVDFRPVRNSPLHGWGIRRFPDGRIYNVSGLDAVEVLLHGGRRIRLGTDQPQELVRALRARTTSVAAAPMPDA